MTETARKRISKWDMMSETHFPIGQETVQPAKVGDTCDGKSSLDWSPSKRADSQKSKWPDSEANNATIHKDCSEGSPYPRSSDLETNNAALSKDCIERSHISKWSDLKAEDKDCSKRSNWQPVPGNGDEQKDNNVNKKSSGWGTSFGQSYNLSLPAGPDAWCQPRHSVSPKRGWGRSHRSRSRSSGRDRSRSRSRGSGRDRSRSPFHDSRREGEGWDDRREVRRRMGTGSSSAPCRDFMAGKCRRGSLCRYLHEESGRRQSDRYSDSRTVEIRESRFDRGRPFGQETKEYFTDPVDQRDYLQDKLVHGPGSHYDGEWKKPVPHTNSKAAARCHDYMKGTCQRGSACKYVHQNPSSDAGWHMKEGARDRARDRGDTDSCSGIDQRPESRRVNDTLCKYFAEGRCRKGESCRFSHRDLAQSQTEGRTFDVKWAQNSGSENRMELDGPKWGDQPTSVAALNSTKWQRDENGARSSPHTICKEESGQNLLDERPQYPEEDIKYKILPKEASQATSPVQSQNTTQEVSGKQQQYVSTFSAEPIAENAYVQGHTGVDRRDIAPRANESITIIRHNKVIDTLRSQNEVNLYADNQPSVAAMPGQSFNQSRQSQYVIPQPPNAQNFSPVRQSQQMVSGVPFSGQSQQQIAISLPLNVQSQFLVPQLPSNVQNFNLGGESQQIPPPPFNGHSQQSSHLLPSSGQSQIMNPQPFQNVIGFNIEQQGQQIPSQPPMPDHQIQPSQEEPLQKKDMVETKASQITSDNLHTQKVVTSEQVVQLTNLSASLSQLFGNGQQLPQLYAALNPPNVNGSVPSHLSSTSSLATVAASYIQPNQGPLSQPQCNPMSDIVELKTDIGNLPPGFSSNFIGQQNTTIKESQAPLKTSAPLSAMDGPNSSTPDRGVGLEDNHESKPVDRSGENESMEFDGTAIGQSKKEQQTARSEDVDADGQIDGESKKSKDAKGIRMFKFALVEAVKDILKPTWKEGHMSKEAHKTIVKKVVDKVTSTLEPNIPQTQQRIDLYLSYSKEKLNKLVQAYVEKYLKT